MEPFVAEQEERISNTSATNHHHQQKKGPTLLVFLLVCVVLVICVALVAILYVQQRSFDALQSNFMSLQTRLDAPTSQTPAEENSLEEALNETPLKTEPSNALPNAASPTIPDLSAIEGKIASLESAISNLKTDLAKVESKIPGSNVTTTSSADIKALSATTTGLNSAIKALRDELLSIKFSLNDIEANKMTEDSEMERRLNSLEQAVMSLNESRRNTENNTSSGSTDAAALNRIYRELELLKKQHPYLKN